MNRVSAALIVAGIIVAACIIYLTVNGISLRAAPLIRPSAMDADQKNVAKALTTRLFQELQNSQYIIWGTLPLSAESQQLLNSTAEEYKKIFNRPVHFLRDAENATVNELLSCPQPCWLLVSGDRAHHLENNSFIEDKILSTKKSFISITIVPFNVNESVPVGCEDQKRLTFKCYIPISVRAVQRKIKDPQKRYFFLNKYYDQDFFLFIQIAT